MSKRTLLAGAAVFLLLALPIMVWAGERDTSAAGHEIALGAGSQLWLEGTSTVHDFECRSTEVSLAIEGDVAAESPRDAGALLAWIRSERIRGVAVRVPVRSLRSGKEALDKNLRRAMRAEQHPDVHFRMARYRVTSPASEDTVAIHAEGTLAISGRERTVDLEARAHRAGTGVWLEGSETVRMSEYGIKPPTMMLGTLRVGDRVTVRYRLLLVPGSERPVAPPHRSQ